MIPVLNAAGYRTIVPDLIGFGRSDKPMSMDTHTYLFHVDAMTELVDQLDLTEVTFFGQDWGRLDRTKSGSRERRTLRKGSCGQHWARRADHQGASQFWRLYAMEGHELGHDRSRRHPYRHHGCQQCG